MHQSCQPILILRETEDTQQHPTVFSIRLKILGHHYLKIVEGKHRLIILERESLVNLLIHLVLNSNKDSKDMEKKTLK